MENIALTSEEKSQLQEWICGKRNKGKFALLYKMTRDGWNATTFHTKCDNKGPTITVLYSTNGTVHGGYTSQSWTSSAQGFYGNDPKAFLFQLRSKKERNLQQFTPLVKIGNNQFPTFVQKGDNGNNAIYCCYNYGPTFGSGHDLLTFKGNSETNDAGFQLNGQFNLGSSYVNKDCPNDGHLIVYDLEVYQFDDESDFVVMDIPWRDCPDWDEKLLEELKYEVENYMPAEETNILAANILLMGEVGSGKSSFINTINSTFRGNITSPAITGTSAHSLTNVLKIYKMKSRLSSKSLKFHLVDTPGLEGDQGIDSQELCYILDGNLPDRYRFNPSCQATPAIPGFKKNPEMKDKIHLVAFVVDASKIYDMSDGIISKIQNLRLKISQRDIPQVVLLTKIDTACEVVGKDTSKTFFSKVLRGQIDYVAKLIGLPRGHVMPVKNYECEIALHQNVTILSLLALRQILRFADDHLVNSMEMTSISEKSPSD